MSKLCTSVNASGTENKSMADRAGGDDEVRRLCEDAEREQN
jgi:hypothetical protein